MLGIIVNATGGIFDGLFREQQQPTGKLIDADELGELLQKPFPLLLRFHALAKIGKSSQNKYLMFQ